MPHCTKDFACQFALDSMVKECGGRDKELNELVFFLVVNSLFFFNGTAFHKQIHDVLLPT